jgi:cysteine synthase A
MSASPPTHHSEREPRIARDLTGLVGRTPLVWLDRVDPEVGGRVAGKLEFFNPAASVKDRIGLSMLLAAEREGRIGPDTTIVEPTSGNTGIALAWVAACRGYRIILTMPATMTRERRDLLTALGAELILTPADEGMRGAVRKARELAQRLGDVFIPSQFDNAANPQVHYTTTGPEVWRDTAGRVGVFVAGIGTGGTISGAGRYLKEQDASTRVVGVEPAESPLFSEGHSAEHRVEGIGPNFVPAVFDRSVVDEIVPVAEADAFRTTRALARREGIIAGISAGAAVHAAFEIARRPDLADRLVVVILPDTGERYLSTWVYRS